MVNSAVSRPDGAGTQTRPMTGIMLKVLSVAIFVTMAAFIKATGQLPAGQIVFFRSIFAMLPIFVWLAWRGQIGGALKTPHPFRHIFRGLVGVTAMGLSFYGLTRVPFPEAITLGYAKPLLVVVFSALFLGETVRMFRWTAVLVGLAGVILISWPNLTILTTPGALSDDQVTGMIAILASAAVAACAMLLVRRLVRTERTPTIVIWFSLTASAAGLATLPFGWVPLSATQLLFLIIAGFLGGLAQIVLTQSYRHADMSTIAPFEYISLILSVAIGFAIFNELPTPWTLGGGALVVAAGIFIIFREHRLGLERKEARRVQPPH